MSTLLNVLVVLIGIAGVFFFKSERTDPKARGMAWLSGALAIVGIFNLLLHLAVWVTLLSAIILIAAGAYHYRHDDKAKANRVTKVSSVGAIGALALALIFGSGATGLFAQSDSSNPAAVTAMVDGKPKEFIPVNSSGPIKFEKPATDAITYYAYKAEPGTNNDGPAITLTKAEDGLARLNEKTGNDPAFLAQVTEYDVAHEGFDNARAQRRAEMYAQKADARHNDAAAFMENIKKADLVSMNGVRYDSTGMIPSKNWDESKLPQLTKFSIQPDLGQVLVVTMKDGDVLFFRVACDLQPSAPHFPNVSPPATPEKPAVTPPTPYVPPTPPTKVTPPPPKTTPPTSPPTTTPPSSTTTPPSSTTTTTTTTTTPPSSTTTPPSSTTPTKDPSEDPCKTGNDPHGCQTDNGDPITADPTPSDPAVPESDAPATYTPPPPPPPSTTEREIPVPTENQGAPTDAPVTGDIGDTPVVPGTGNGGDDGSNDGACPVCGPVDDGSGNGGNQPPAAQPEPVVPLAPPAAPEPAPAVVPVPAPAPAEANGGNDGASGPAVGENQAPAEQQPAAQPEPAPAPAAANPESVSIVPTAFSRSTSQDNLASLVLIVVAVCIVGSAFVPARSRGHKRHH